MFMIIKKKQVISVICILILTTAIFINLKYSDANDENIKTTSVIENDENPDPGEAVLVSTNADYYIKAKNDREIVRSKACEILNDTIENPSVSEGSRKNAEEKIIKMSEDMDKEMKCESILSAKGFVNSVVFISDGAVTVTIDSSYLKENDVAKINDIIFQETGNNNIKIVEVG